MKQQGESYSPVIRCVGLSKNFGPVQAVRSLELSVRRGEVYGFLGRNGAGKTTTIRMLLGLVHPEAGRVELFGETLGRANRKALRRVGCLVEGAAAYRNLTVRENLEIQRRLTESPPDAVRRAAGLMGLEELLERRAGRLSLGNKQRLSLARAILHVPELLILDEPANALDPAGIAELRSTLRTLVNERGMTIFISSHILSEVEAIADRIGIIHRGSLIEELVVAEAGNSSARALQIEVGDPAAAERLLRGQQGFGRIEALGSHGLRIEADAEAAPALARLLVLAGIELRSMTPVVEGLEQHFLRLTEDSE